MATRSTIALEYIDGTVDQIYCHWDGYLDNNGEILRTHYTDPFKVRDMMDLGDISSLGPNIGRKHAFSPFEGDEADYEAAKEEGCTTFYMRDRGESGVGAKRFKNFEEYESEHQYEEYEYILRKDGNWYVCFYVTEGKYVPLSEAFELQALEEQSA